MALNGTSTTRTEAIFASMPDETVKKAAQFLLTALEVAPLPGASAAALKNQLADALNQTGAHATSHLVSTIRAEAKKLLDDAQRASISKDPIDWYVSSTPQKQALWWLVTAKMVEDALIMAYVANGLETAAEP